MCGRYARFTPQHLYASLFGARDMGTLSPRYNIAPSQAILVARNSEWGDYRELATLYWGLVAHWAKDFQSARKMINAGAETAHERPMFRKALAHRRCLVAADGFYERTRINGHRQPFPRRWPLSGVTVGQVTADKSEREGATAEVRMESRPRKPVTTPATRAPRVFTPDTLDKYIRVFVSQQTPGGLQISGWVRTLGPGGLFVEASGRFDAEEAVIVDALARSGSRALHLRAEGWVAYTGESGMGIQFGDLEPEMVHRVAEVMEHYRHPG